MKVLRFQRAVWMLMCVGVIPQMANAQDADSLLPAIAERLQNTATTEQQRAADIDLLRQVVAESSATARSLTARSILIRALNRADEVDESISLASEALTIEGVRNDTSAYAAWLLRHAWLNERPLNAIGGGSLDMRTFGPTEKAGLDATTNSYFTAFFRSKLQWFESVSPAEVGGILRAGCSPQFYVDELRATIAQCLRCDRIREAIEVTSQGWPVVEQSLLPLGVLNETQLNKLYTSMAFAHIYNGNTQAAVQSIRRVSEAEFLTGAPVLDTALFALERGKDAEARRFIVDVISGDVSVEPTSQWISSVVLAAGSASSAEEATQSLSLLTRIDEMLARPDHPGFQEYRSSPIRESVVSSRDARQRVETNYGSFRLQVAKLRILQMAGVAQESAASEARRSLLQAFPGTEQLIDSYLR